MSQMVCISCTTASIGVPCSREVMPQASVPPERKGTSWTGKFRRSPLLWDIQHSLWRQFCDPVNTKNSGCSVWFRFGFRAWESKTCALADSERRAGHLARFESFVYVGRIHTSPSFLVLALLRNWDEHGLLISWTVIVARISRHAMLAGISTGTK